MRRRLGSDRFILNFGAVAGHGARDRNHADEITSCRVVAFELMFLDNGVLAGDQRGKERHSAALYGKVESESMLVCESQR